MIAGIGHNGGPIIEDRYYQANAVQSVLDYYLVDMKKGNPLVAMPTGTGKSIVIARLIQRLLERWPNTRFIMAVHVKELIVQNAEELQGLLPTANLGIYSASLKQRHFQQNIIYGGIASMIKAPTMFGHRDVLIVDEAHLISGGDSTQYVAFIRALKATNPGLIVIGFTATKYRMGQGLLTNGGIFTDICYDDTTLERFNQLIIEGYLAMLIPQPTEVEIDMRGVLIGSNGDYIQAQAEERAMQVTETALAQAVQHRWTRFSWLIFANGLKHCYQVKEILERHGISCAVIHSNSKEYKITEAERDQRIRDYKEGKYQALINYGVLTTGFNHKPIDLIVMLRSTMSVPLWVQMLGRGTRPFAGNHIFPPKRNCLVLDFARNTSRLGPINDPVIPKMKGGLGGDAPIKICEADLGAFQCKTYNHISARFCISCGHEFIFQTKITEESSKQDLVRDTTPVIERFRVIRPYYRRHESRNSNKVSMSVTYELEDALPVTEYVSIESQTGARKHAENWWLTRSAEPLPETIAEALEKISLLRVPTHIMVQTNLKYPEIVRFEYE